MLEEALFAPHAVAHQFREDQEAYAALGQRLQQRPPSGVATIARGSSDHAASYLAYLTTLRTGHMVTSLPMSLITLHKTTLAADRLLAVAISQSGRSPDVVEPMQALRSQGATTVALVNDIASPLAEAVEAPFPLRAGPEQSVAATKSFICSLSAAARLVAHWSGHEPLLEALPRLPEALECACVQDWSEAVPVLAETERLMVLARGLGLAIAQEAALKFKETCGIQAEAFSAAEVKHGPQALVGEGYTLLMFALRGPAQTEILALAGEMKARGARVILAAPKDVPQRNVTLATTGCEDLDPLAAIQSFYLLAEAVSRAKDRDPDHPPFLKKVTATR